MSVFVQDKYNILFDNFFSEFLEVKIKEFPFEVLIGDFEYVSRSNKSIAFQFERRIFIIVSSQSISLTDYQKYSGAQFYNDEDLIQTSKLIKDSILFELNNHISNEFFKSNRLKIEAKRSELEIHNELLKQKSEEKYFILSKFYKDELLNKNKEKELFYFLDFINAEYTSSDFILQILKKYWTDLRRFGTFYRIGFVLQNIKLETYFFKYDGQIDKVKNIKLDQTINSDNLASILASVFHRPIGQTISYSVSQSEYLFIFYIENQGTIFNKIDTQEYLQERMSLLAIVIQKWFLEYVYKNVLQKWKNLFKSYSDPIHVIDNKYNLLQSNYEIENLDNKKCYNLLARLNEPCKGCPVLELIGNSSHDKLFINQINYQAKLSEFSINHEKYYFIMYENKTEIDTLKLNLIQAEKMSTIGQLSNHLAHELNNPLTGLKLYAELLVLENRFNNPTHNNDLKEVLKAVQRSQLVLNDLSLFASTETTELVILDFSEILKKTLTLLKSIIRNHKVFIDLKKTQILGHVVYLQHIIFNLIKNSCQAIPENGIIKIYQIDSADFIDFIIEDNGQGLPIHIVQNLFQPFFTTKKMKDGTGLGLYLSKKLMIRMNSEILYNAQFKNGTQFILRFRR